MWTAVGVAVFLAVLTVPTVVMADASVSCQRTWLRRLLTAGAAVWFFGSLGVVAVVVGGGAG